jgi:hypothetical protein
MFIIYKMDKPDELPIKMLYLLLNRTNYKKFANYKTVAENDKGGLDILDGDLNIFSKPFISNDDYSKTFLPDNEYSKTILRLTEDEFRFIILLIDDYVFKLNHRFNLKPP